MIVDRGELNFLDPIEYQKQTVEMQKFRVAHQPHLNIPKPAGAPATETAKLTKVRGVLHTIATSEPGEIVSQKGANATGAGKGGLSKGMLFASIALAPVFLVIGVAKEAIGRGYQKLKT